MARPFANKVITITGGARGMGLATARYLAERGGTVCLADVRKPELEQAKELLKNDFPDVKVQADVVDVRHGEQVTNWINSVKKNHGKIDGCLNGAGITGAIGKMMKDYSDADWGNVIDVNLRGVFNCLRAQLGTVEQGGSIVNIASISGLRGMPGISGYTASKFGVRGLTRCAAHEAAEDRKRVNDICPGGVETPMMKEVNELLPMTGETIVQLFKRNGQPVEIAALVAFLLSDESKFITGASYNIDGGFCA